MKKTILFCLCLYSTGLAQQKDHIDSGEQKDPKIFQLEPATNLHPLKLGHRFFYGSNDTVLIPNLNEPDLPKFVPYIDPSKIDSSKLEGIANGMNKEDMSHIKNELGILEKRDENTISPPICLLCKQPRKFSNPPMADREGNQVPLNWMK